MNSMAKHNDGRVMQITVGDNLPTVEFKFLNDKCNVVNLTEQQAVDDKDHEVEEQLPKKMVDEPVEGRTRMPRLKVDAALELHRSIGHLNVPECALAKGGRNPVVKQRARE